MTDGEDFVPNRYTELRRLPDRGRYGRDTVYGILDEGFLCHVGFEWEGRPVVIPTGYARVGDTLYLHGSPASRMLRTLADGVECCVTVTLLDGLVLARSAFHHSMNYRSVVVLGRAVPVADLGGRAAALDAFVDHVVPGRRETLRPTTERELRGTVVLALPLEEASAKVRTGPPVDDDEDYELPIWAGVLPYAFRAGEAEPDPALRHALDVPAHVTNYDRP